MKLPVIAAAIVFSVAALVAALPASMIATPVAAQQYTPRVCDIDLDGDIDKADLLLIRAALNTPAAPGDPRDANEDGRINVADARFCQLVCTRANCAEY